MRGSGRALAALSCLTLFAAACTLGNGTTNADNTPVPPSPSLLQTSPSSTPGTVASPSSSPTSAPSPAGATLAISSLPFHNGEVGVIYLAVSLSATGGTPSYSWSITGGAFPPGLNLSSGGFVTGNNTGAGNFAFTITVTDSTGATASSAASMRVFPALTVSQPCAGTCSVEQGCNICGNFGSVSGGLPPYHFSIVSDNRPTGMGVNGLNVTGSFPAPGQTPFSLVIKVTDDQFGATRTVTAHWSVFSHINFSGQPSYTCGNSPSSCTLSITYTGGTPGGSPTVKLLGIGPITGVFTGPPPPPTMTVPVPPTTSQCFPNTTVTPTALPPGTTITSGSGIVTMNIGPPDQTTWCGYQAQATIELVDQSPCGPGNCTTTTTVTIEIAI